MEGSYNTSGGDFSSFNSGGRRGGYDRDASWAEAMEGEDVPLVGGVQAQPPLEHAAESYAVKPVAASAERPRLKLLPRGASVSMVCCALVRPEISARSRLTRYTPRTQLSNRKLVFGRTVT